MPKGRDVLGELVRERQAELRRQIGHLDTIISERVKDVEKFRSKRGELVAQSNDLAFAAADLMSDA